MYMSVWGAFYIQTVIQPILSSEQSRSFWCVSQSIQVGPISLKSNIILPNDERYNRPTWVQSTLAFKQGCHIEHKENFLFKSIKKGRIVSYPTKGQGLEGENFDTGAQLAHGAMSCTFLQNFLDSVWMRIQCLMQRCFSAAAQGPENCTQTWQGAQKSEHNVTRCWSGLLISV